MATATHLLTPEEAEADGPLEAVVVRFAGDSGDGMQLTGGEVTPCPAPAGDELPTFAAAPGAGRAPSGPRAPAPTACSCPAGSSRSPPRSRATTSPPSPISRPRSGRRRA